MAIRVTCEKCGLRLAAKDDLAGKTLRCPNCATEIKIVAGAGAKPGTGETPFVKKQSSAEIASVKKTDKGVAPVKKRESSAEHKPMIKSASGEGKLKPSAPAGKAAPPVAPAKPAPPPAEKEGSTFLIDPNASADVSDIHGRAPGSAPSPPPPPPPKPPALGAAVNATFTPIEDDSSGSGLLSFGQKSGVGLLSGNSLVAAMSIPKPIVPPKPPSKFMFALKVVGGIVGGVGAIALTGFLSYFLYGKIQESNAPRGKKKADVATAVTTPAAADPAGKTADPKTADPKAVAQPADAKPADPKAADAKSATTTPPTSPSTTPTTTPPGTALASATTPATIPGATPSNPATTPATGTPETPPAPEVPDNVKIGLNHVLSYHTGNVECAVFSHDSKFVLTAGADRTIALWDVETGTRLKVFTGHEGPVKCVDFAPDGKTFISGSEDHTVRLWDIQSGNELKKFDGHVDFVTSVAYSPTAAQAVSAGVDKLVKQWDLKAGKELRTLAGHQDPIWCVRISSDGAYAISSSGGTQKADVTLRLWDLESGAEAVVMKGHDSPVYNVRLFDDSVHAISADSGNSVRIWSLTGRQIQKYDRPSGFVVSMDLSADNNWVVEANRDHVLRIWILPEGNELMTFPGHTAPVNTVAFAKNNRYIVSGSADGSARIWGVPRPTMKPFAAVAALDSATPGSAPVAGGGKKFTPGMVLTETGAQVPKDITNSIGMKLAFIPAGEFDMGAPEAEMQGEAKIDGYESAFETPHKVKITSSFYMGVYEVTQAEYYEIMGNNPSATQDYPLPVENVTWYQATTFCRKLSRRESRVYRLPTEAEWEYACRAGSTSPTMFGVSLTAKDANTGPKSYGVGSRMFDALNKTSPVGKYSPNSNGLYDMHGNVWEWCSDWYDPDYYVRSPAADPGGPVIGLDRSVRGGGFDADAVFCRSASRNQPGLGKPSEAKPSIGFRVVMELSAPKKLPPAPDAAEQKKAETRIRTTFKAQYAQKAAESRMLLAKKLFDSAASTRDDPTAKFVLYREASDVAAEAGNGPVAVRAVDEMSRIATFDAVTRKADVLEKASRKVETEEEAAEVMGVTLDLVNRAITEDKYELATRLAAIATAVSKKLKENKDLNEEARVIGNDVRDLKKASEKLQSSLITLAARPDDPTANLEIGKFYCFAKGDWDKGLAMLAKASDPKLQQLAKSELEKPTDPEIQVKIGDGWKVFGELEKDSIRRQLFQRARAWYSKAIPSLTGLRKAEVEGFVSSLDEAIAKLK